MRWERSLASSFKRSGPPRLQRVWLDGVVETEIGRGDPRLPENAFTAGVSRNERGLTFDRGF
jgi:hypothetical protein